MKRVYLAMGCALAVMVAASEVWAQHHEHTATTEPVAAPAALRTPEAIRVEHHHLHQELAEALAAGGKTAAAAQQVQAALAPHFAEEEAYAMPPLSLLPVLAQRQQPSDEQVHVAIAMSDRLRANYKQMLAEHQKIVGAIEELAKAAKKENKPQPAQFAEMLMLHAQNEEQVLYPATLLVGDYLKLKAVNAHAEP